MIRFLDPQDAQDHPEAQAWLRHLTSRGTSAETPRPPTPGPLDPASWRRLSDRAMRGRVTWCLLDAIRAGHLPVLPEQGQLASEAHRQAMAHCLRLDRALVRVVDLLDAAGIEARVLKGPATAVLDHAAPEERQYGDIDVLVQVEQFEQAVDVLARAGVARAVPTMADGFDPALSKGATLRDGTLEVDLHHAIAPGAFAVALASGPLWRPGQPFAVGDRTFIALDQPTRLAHTAAHLVLGNADPQLSTARDLLVQLDATAAEATAPTAQALGLTAALVGAVRTLHEAGIEAPGPWRDWAHSVRVPPSEQDRYDRHLAAGDQYREMVWQAVMELPWRERTRRLRTLVLPSPEHLAARGRTRRQHLTHVVLAGVGVLRSAVTRSVRRTPPGRGRRTAR